MKILVIEDDLVLNKNVSAVLQKNGFAVDQATNYQQAKEAIDINTYDCLVLDLNLPDGNGFSLLNELRANSDQTPVVIVTARSEITEKISGLNSGADDYVTKPVDTQELIARIRAIIRRNTTESLPVITIGPLTIKPAEHSATINNKSIELTAKEFAVLEYLAYHKGQAITRTMLMEHIWGSDFDTFSNVIDVYIRSLRKKISAQTNEQLIKTIRGKGYVLAA